MSVTIPLPSPEAVLPPGSIEGKFDSSPKDESPVFKTTLDGESNIGTIVHIKQIHKADSTQSEYDRGAITLSQELILRELVQNKYNVVAKEGSEETLLPGSRERENYCNTEEVNSLFPDRKIPDLLSLQQRDLLFERGAIKIYAALNPDVTMLRTTTPDQEDEVYKIIDDPNATNDDIHYYTFEVRERIAINHICAYLKENPGATVALVYGSAHHFGDKVFHEWESNQKKPRICSVAFPIIWRKYPALYKLVWPLDEVKIVQEAELLHCYDFSYLKEELSQSMALAKLSGQYVIFTEQKKFKEFLLVNAASDKVKHLVRQYYKTGTGPFKEFQYRIDVPWNWETISKLDIHSSTCFLEEEKDPRTQYELVHRMQKVDEIVFGRLYAEWSQELALKKLHFTVGNYPAESRQQLRKYLLTYARNPRVKGLIEDLFLNEQGPFEPKVRKSATT